MTGICTTYFKDARLAPDGELSSPGVALVYSHQFPLVLAAAKESPELARLVSGRFLVIGHFSWCPEDNPSPVGEAQDLKRAGLLHLVMQRVSAGFFHRQGFAPHEIIPLSIGDLVDPAIFRPCGGGKTIDVLAISRLRRWKRLEILIGALAEIRARTGRKLICRILDSHRGRVEPDTARELEALIAREGLGGQVEIGSVPDADVPSILSCARASAVCSAVEGECRAITESLFCDVPVIAMQGMRGGGIQYLTDDCGLLTTPERFADDLLRLVDSSGTYHPRAGVSRVTGRPVAWPRLEAALRGYFAATGRACEGPFCAPEYLKLLKAGTETLTVESLKAHTIREGAPGGRRAARPDP